MDAIKLRMRAKDQLYPMLQELVTSYSRFKGSKDLEGRGKLVAWLVHPHIFLGLVQSLVIVTTASLSFHYSFRY